MAGTSQAVFRNGYLHADLFRSCGERRSGWVVVTFTERCNRDLEGPGFGTEFLLREGFDVLAVRNGQDDWYANLDLEELAALRGALEPYTQRATYGSSMGAFAAVKFAKPLGASRALAISPIVDVFHEWDTRNRVDIPLIQRAGYRAAGDMFNRSDISTDTTYHIAFDPLCDEDARHAQMLCEIAERHTLLRVRLGGHPVGPAMRDSGILGEYVKQAITTDSIDALAVKIEKNGRFMHSLARYLFGRNKLRSATIANERALSLSPEWGEVHLLHAQIAHRLGCIQKTRDYGLDAIRLEIENPYVVAIVGRMLMDQQNFELARELVETAIKRMGPQHVLVELRSDLETDGHASPPTELG